MTSVDITAGTEPDFGSRLATVEDLVATWDLDGAQTAARALLDEPGLPPADRLTARRLLAEALRELGDLDAAYDLAEAVAAQAEQAYGPAAVSTVHAWAVLAAVRHDYDEWDEAEALYHRVLDSGVDESDPVTGAEAARVIRLTRVNLALLQRDRGQRPLALAMLNAAYVVHRREYGADDLDTIRIAAELAALHHADGNVPASRRLFTLAHAAARSRLGNRHPFTKAVEWELAAVESPMPTSLLHPVEARPAVRRDDTAPAATAAAAVTAAATGDVTAPAAAPDGFIGAEGGRVTDTGGLCGAGDLADVGDLADFDGRADDSGLADLDGLADDGGLDGLADDGDLAEFDDLDDFEDLAPVTAPPEVSGGTSRVHGASSDADAGHPGVVDRSVAGAPPVVGERRVVVPLKAVAAVAVAALVIAAGSVLWSSGNWPGRSAGKPADAVGSARAGDGGSSGSSGSDGAAGSNGGAGSDGAGSDGAAGQGGAGAGSETPRVRDLTLRDDGTALAVTWTGLRDKVVVALSRAGGPAVVVAEVPPGTTSYVVKGVDPSAAYCVVVGPVDATVAVTPGSSVCTGRR